MILIYKFNVDYKNNTKKIFIEALEQRIMLDGAGASTFLDILTIETKTNFYKKIQKKLQNFLRIKLMTNHKNFLLIKLQEIKKETKENKLYL